MRPGKPYTNPCQQGRGKTFPFTCSICGEAIYVHLFSPPPQRTAPVYYGEAAFFPVIDRNKPNWLGALTSGPNLFFPPTIRATPGARRAIENLLRFAREQRS